MALDKVANDILENARKEADLRIQEAEKERTKILQEADQKIEKMRKSEEKGATARHLMA
jgi:F0F1-type ATP synthase membrane subunit b/b'